MAPAARTNFPVDFQTWNAIAATPLDFMLHAGKYGLALKAGVWGTATLQKYESTSDSYFPISAAIGANGYVVLDLPAGQYQLTLAGITALSGSISKIDAGRVGARH